jgi:hypothetical protein
MDGNKQRMKKDRLAHLDVPLCWTLAKHSMIHDSFAPSSIIQLGWFGAPNHTKWMEKEKMALLLYEYIP